MHQHNISHLLLQTNIVRNIVSKKTYAHVGKSSSDQEKFFQKLIARNKVRKRLKTLLAYFIAERDNLLLVSKTNKTEWFTGLITPFGYGHAADIMPLGDLYRTQVLQLAETVHAYMLLVMARTPFTNTIFQLHLICPLPVTQAMTLTQPMGWWPVNCRTLH